MPIRHALVVPPPPEGAPTWTYVVLVVAAVLVAAITAAPAIIERLRGAPPTTPPDTPGSGAHRGDHQPVVAATDTVRTLIADLQDRLTRSEHREDQLQERIVQLTGELERARMHVQMMSTRRDDHG